MTALTTNPGRTSGKGLVHEVASRITSWLAENSRGSGALNACRKFASMSDIELSELGIKRDQIVKKAFSPYYYG